MAEKYCGCIECNTVAFSIQPSVYRHLRCSHVLAVVKNAAVNTKVAISLWDGDFISLDICPEVGWLDPTTGVLFLAFGGMSILFP